MGIASLQRSNSGGRACANSLRVMFVDGVVPDAKYIFIYRDGLDVVGSAIKRWKAELDIPYLLRKAFLCRCRFAFLCVSLPLESYLPRDFARGTVCFWGPQFKGLDEALATERYRRSAYSSGAAWIFQKPPFSNAGGKVARVSYEAFVSKPVVELRRIAEELNLSLDLNAVGSVVKGVNSNSIGKGRDVLDDKTSAAITSLVGDTLGRYGFA